MHVLVRVDWIGPRVASKRPKPAERPSSRPYFWERLTIFTSMSWSMSSGSYATVVTMDQSSKHGRVRSTYNEEVIGDCEAGPEMHFSLFDLIEHLAKTRRFTAGTILGSGTELQRERFAWPILGGTQRWCQLFSEPGAGSDLASLTTRARKVDGGWLVNGHKIWTSQADRAQFGAPTIASYSFAG